MKNLETEYKNQISHEAPDLWDRIEVGIDKIEAEKAATQATATQIPVQAAPQTNIQQFPTQQYAENTVNVVSIDNAKRLKTRKIFYTIGRVTTVALALVVVAVSIGIVRGKLGGDRSTAPRPQSNAAAATKSESNDAASPAMEAEATADSAATYSPAAEAADASEYVNEASEATSPAAEDVRGDEADDALKAPDSDSEFTFEYRGGNQKWHDKLLERLGDLGFTDISDLELAKFNPAKSSNIYNATFYYEEIDEKCIVYFAMFVGENSDDIEILDIAPVSDPQNYLYKISSDDD